jgi:hypothetical protein
LRSYLYICRKVKHTITFRFGTDVDHHAVSIWSFKKLWLTENEVEPAVMCC